MIQFNSASAPHREQVKRSSGYWGALLERKLTEALVLSYWDVEQSSHADRVKVDIVLRRNLRKLQIPRPILIQATTWLDNRDKYVRIAAAFDARVYEVWTQEKTRRAIRTYLERTIGR